MVKASDLFPAASSGSGDFPHASYGAGSYYQPYPVAASSGTVTTGANFTPVYINSTAKVGSLVVNIAGNETRPLGYCLFKVGSSLLTLGREIFNEVAEGTLTVGQNELVLPAPVTVEAGWYLLGLGRAYSSGGVGKIYSPIFYRASFSEDTIERLAFPLPADQWLAADGSYGLALRTASSTTTPQLAEGTALAFNDTTGPAFSLGMET